MAAVMDITHVASSGVFKENPQQSVNSCPFNCKDPVYSKEHDESIKQIIKFTNK